MVNCSLVANLSLVIKNMHLFYIKLRDMKTNIAESLSKLNEIGLETLLKNKII